MKTRGFSLLWRQHALHRDKVIGPTGCLTLIIWKRKGCFTVPAKFIAYKGKQGRIFDNRQYLTGTLNPASWCKIEWKYLNLTKQWLH